MATGYTQPLDEGTSTCNTAEPHDGETSKEKDTLAYPWKEIKDGLVRIIAEEDIFQMYRALTRKMDTLEVERTIDDVRKECAGKRKDEFHNFFSKLEIEYGNEFTPDLLEQYFRKEGWNSYVKKIAECLEGYKRKEDFTNKTCEPGRHSQSGRPRQVSETVSELESMLKGRAIVEYGKGSYPVETDRKIKRVPLQLSTDVKMYRDDVDGKGQYSKRSDFKKCVLSSDGNIKLREVFVCAEKKAEKKSKNESTRDAKRKFVERHGNIVAMIGNAGVGKTTLSRMLLQDVIEGKMLKKTKFLFYIPFRKVDFVSETTLMKFALTGCCNWEHSEESDKELLNALKDNENTLFVFDGLDEADKLPENIHSCSLFSSQKAETFVAKILSGEFFPKAKKLLTSSPRQFFELHSDHRPTFVVDILGLNEEAQLELCRQICGDSHKTVMSFLKSNPDILSSCYVPINCIITMHVINENLIENKQINIRSLTDVFVQVLEAFVRSEHVRGKLTEVRQLSKLAWDGLQDKQIVFSEQDCANAGISKGVLEAFLRIFIKGDLCGRILDGKRKISFSHLTFQELFAAIYVMIFLSVEDFRDLISEEKLKEPLWEIVTKFMFGLCNPFVMHSLTEVLNEKYDSLKDKKKALYEVLCRSLDKSGSNGIELMPLLSWIREAGDKDLNEMFPKFFPDHISFPKKISPPDAVNITYVLKYIQHQLTISFSRNTNVSSRDFKLICEQFKTTQNKLKKLNLSYNKIDNLRATALAECFCNIDELEVTGCEIPKKAKETMSHQAKQDNVNILNRFGSSESASGVDVSTSKQSDRSKTLDGSERKNKAAGGDTHLLEEVSEDNSEVHTATFPTIHDQVHHVSGGIVGGSTVNYMPMQERDDLSDAPSSSDEEKRSGYTSKQTSKVSKSRSENPLPPASYWPNMQVSNSHSGRVSSHSGVTVYYNQPQTNYYGPRGQ